MYKTKANLLIIRDCVDTASGSLHNALDAIARMRTLPQEIRDLADRIDITKVDRLLEAMQIALDKKEGE